MIHQIVIERNSPRGGRASETSLEPEGNPVKKATLGLVLAMMLAVLPVSLFGTSAVAADSPTSIHVINAMGNTGTDTAKTTTGPSADVHLTCDTTQAADISVVDPNGTADDGSHTFVIPNGKDPCDVSVTADYNIALTAGGTTPVHVECAKSTGFSSNSYYKLVIEPIYTTFPGTASAAFPLALTGCTIHKWQDDTSVLPNGYARFTVRHAACETGKNLHITSVTANGNEVLGPIDACNDATVELPEGVYHFVINLAVDPNGDGVFNDFWTAFSPHATSQDPPNCDQVLGTGAPLSDYSLAGCPTIDESAGQTADIGNISLAHGQAFVFNFVDNNNGFVVPFLAGGASATDDIATAIPTGAPPAPTANCDDLIIPLGTTPPTFGPAVIAGAANGAAACVGGGLGVIAGASTAQVQFVPNELPASDAATAAFCTALLGPPGFQGTTKAETDYIATLTVVDATDTKLEGLVNDTDAAIQQLLALAPLEIRPQVVILTNGLQQLNEGLRAASFNTATLGADALDQIQTSLANPPANPEVDAATAVLTAWVPANCFPANPTTPAATPITGVAAKFTG